MDDVRKNGHEVAHGLGAFSLGLGLAQLAAPGWLGKATGLGDHPALIRALGARELASGVGVLAERRPSKGLWARAVGDALDLGLLGWSLGKVGQRRPRRRLFGLRRRSERRRRLAVSMAMVAGVMLLDVVYARRMKGD